MNHTIWVFIDHFKGKGVPASWEAIGAGRALAEKLGGSLTALVFGEQVNELAEQALQYGADEVLLCDDQRLSDFRAEPYTGLLTGLAAERSPETIIFPTTTRCRELAAMCAVDLQAGLLVDVIALDVQDGRLAATRPVYAGKLLAKVICLTKPQLVTLRVRAFPKPTLKPSPSGKITRVTPTGIESGIPTQVVGYIQPEAAVSLIDASIIVSGGRGVANNPTLTPPAGLDEKAAETWRATQGFKQVAELAAVLEGAMGASRAAVDAGYVPYVYQVGQTGKVVSPDLYIALGISGAIQHQAGMRTSKVIVAINKDPDAPIFKMARYGVVGDVHQILPSLIQAFKTRLGV